MARSARSGHSPRRRSRWIVLSAIATPLVAIFARRRSRPATAACRHGQVFDNKVLIAVSTPICVFVLLFLVYATSTARAACGTRCSAGRQGLVGKELVDGKPLVVMPPDQPSHTFAVPALGVLVPIAPVADNAKNPCGYAPCAMSTAHRTITFTFRTGKPGHYRWQCFVPCAAGFMYGFGGPMQTIGYMDGFLNVV